MSQVPIYTVDTSTESINVVTDDVHPSLPDNEYEDMVQTVADFYTSIYRIVHMPLLFLIDSDIHGVAYGMFQTNLLRDFK